MSKLLFQLLFWGVCATTTHAQISKKHYIPPVFGLGANSNNPFTLVLTTLETDTFDVSIKNGDGTYSQTVSLSKDHPQEITPKINNTLIGHVTTGTSTDT
ncbi:MAG: hypothetical protein OCD76_18855, partial [Reichenbachiella sp.]